MSYGKLLEQVAEQGNAMVLYPVKLEEMTMDFPKIQYEETDWEFLKRMASRFGLSLYPYLEQCRVGCRQESLRRSYWNISAREATEWCGTVNTMSWGQRRLTHKKLSGLSLLGEVISREGERLKLKLDIDREHSDWKQEKAYAFLWCPPTGNLMYMMPAQGSRVSLYFPRGEEEGAVAVNCIRREGEAQGRSYRERGLKTEGKELKLYPDCMGVESISGKVMLDDLEGIRISGDKALQIIARGKIRIEGKGIQVEGGKEGIRLYHGGVEERGEEILVAATAQLHLLSRQGEAMWVSLGEKSSLLGYEVEDYSAEGFRFKDDPVQEKYDWDAYWSRVAGALVIVGGVTLIAGTGAGILAAGGWAVNATVVMGSAAAGGIIAVGGLAAMDAMSGRLSSAQEYIREALVGSIIGALTGATAQLPTKRLGIVGKNVAEFAIGSGESAVEQQLRKGEIDFREAIGCGILNLILSGVLDNLSREQGVRVKGGEGRVIFFEDELPPEEAERLINFLKNDRKRINYQDIWDIRNSSKVIESGNYSSLRDLMSPEEAARYDKYWNNVADDMLKSNLGDFRSAVLSGDITKTTGGKINSKVVTAAIDTNTGDIYYGISGMNNNPTRNMTNPQMQEILNSVNGSMTNYPLENCGEFNAINNALNNGANIQNLRVYSIDRVSGNYKAPCINCQNLYGDIVHFTE